MAKDKRYKDTPRYKAIEVYESRIKKRYNQMLFKMIKSIKVSLDDTESRKTTSDTVNNL